MSIGQRVKQARKVAGMTQIELAKKTNLSRSYIGDIEIDRYNPSVSTLTIIAEATGVSTAFLLGTPAPDTQYYDDPEVARMANELKNNPDLHILFDASKKLTKKDLEAVITIVQKMSSEE